MTRDQGRDIWRPKPGSKWNYRVSFIADAIGITTGSVGLAALTWTLVSSNDGRIKALLLWSFGVTAAVALIVYRMSKREHRDTRYGRALSSTHVAHHRLRDAAYSRYIAEESTAKWEEHVEASLRQFAVAFSIATGSDCHMAIVRVMSADDIAPSADPDEAFNHYEVQVKYRSDVRPPMVTPPSGEDTVGRNTDFRELFRVDKVDRCWFDNDLLRLGDLYENTHWPAKRTKGNVPYRSTMVWPIRKVVVEAGAIRRRQVAMWGFLTVDSPDTNVFEYKRHFPLGAAYADHLVSVLWDAEAMRLHYKKVLGAPGV